MSHQPALPAIDYTLPADLFWSISAKRIVPRGALRFRTSPTLSEAVCFFVENRTEVRHSCTIDTDAERYEGEEIQALYDRHDFPHES